MALSDLLNPYKRYVMIGLTLVLAFGTWWLTSQIKDGWLAEDLLKSEKLAHSKDLENCTKTITASKELGDDYTDSADRVTDGYISMLEAQYATCMSSAKSGKRDDGSASANQPLTTKQRFLNDKQAAQLINCQKTIWTIYELNGKDNLLPLNQTPNKAASQP